MSSGARNKELDRLHEIENNLILSHRAGKISKEGFERKHSLIKGKIDKLRRKYKKGEFDTGRFIREGKPAKFSLPLLFITLSLYMLFTVYGLSMLLSGGLLNSVTSYFNLQSLQSNYLEFCLILGVLSLVIIALAVLNVIAFLYILMNFGRTVIYIGIVLVAIIQLIALLFAPFVVLFYLPFFLVLLMYVFLTGALDRAVVFLESSARVIWEEKELLLPTFIMLPIVLFLTLSAMGLFEHALDKKVVENTYGTKTYYELRDEPLFFFLLFTYLFLMIFTYFFLMGINTAIVYIWYRGRDPKLRDGLNLIVHRFNKIVLFAIYSSFVYCMSLFIARGGVLQRIASSIINAVWGLINYFTLPTIIILNKPVGRSIGVSARLLAKNIPDVLTKEVFVEKGLRSLLNILFLFYFMVASAVTSVAVGIFPALSTSPHLMLLVFIFAFVTLYMPIIIVLRTMDVAYKTILFSWCLDNESKIKRPYRVPKSMGGVIRRIESFERRGRGILPSRVKVDDLDKSSEVIMTPNSPIFSLAVDDDNIYSCCGADRRINVFDKKGNMLSEKKQLNFGRNSIALDNERIYTFISENKIRILGKKEYNLLGEISDTRIKPPIAVGGDHIYVGFPYNYLGVFDKRTYEFIGKDYHHHLSIIAVSVDEERVYSTDGLDLMISDKQGGTIDNIRTDGGINSLAVDEKHIYLSLRNGRIEVWDKTDYKKILEIQAEQEGINTLTVDEKHIYFGSWNGKIKIFVK